MRLFFVASLLLSSSHTLAMTSEKFNNCLLETEKSNVQFVIGLLQPYTKDLTVDANSVMIRVLDKKTVTCDQAELIIAEAYIEGLKKKIALTK